MTDIHLPSSKSISNRALILSALSGEETVLENVLQSDDTRYLKEMLRGMGVEIVESRKYQVVSMRVKPPKVLKGEGKTFFIGNAGTASRFGAALSLVVEGEYTLTGVDRMRERPFGDLFSALGQCGVEIESGGGLPATFRPAENPTTNQVQISGAISSQFITGLLLVAPKVSGGLQIEIEGQIPSLPYIEMTLEMLSIWGARYDIEGDYEKIIVHPGLKSPGRYTIPADMSAASVPMALSLMTGQEMTLKNIGKKTLQGDEAFEEVVTKAGGKIVPQGDDWFITPGESIKPLGTIDWSTMPDVSMTGMVLAACAEGQSLFTGLESLRVKECDRITAMVEGLKQLGVEVEVEGDVVEIRDKRLGNKRWEGVLIKTHADHRIAFCFSILLYVMGVTDVRVIQQYLDDPGCVSKTWPTFYLDLAEWGGQLRDVSGIVARREEKYLLLKKPRKSHAWQLPQGGVDAGENGLQAAKRELIEEAGDRLQVKWVGERPLGSYRYFFPESFDRHDAGIAGAKVSFYEAQYIDGDITVDDQEIIDHRWVTRDEMQDLVEEDYWGAVQPFLK